MTTTEHFQSIHLQASNAYLQFSQGPGTKMIFEFVKEMPKPETKLRLDLSSLLGTLFFTWVILQLFPVSMSSVLHCPRVVCIFYKYLRLYVVANFVKIMTTITQLIIFLAA